MITSGNRRSPSASRADSGRVPHSTASNASQSKPSPPTTANGICHHKATVSPYPDAGVGLIAPLGRTAVNAATIPILVSGP
jgi:hypothetical protein